MNDGDTRVTRVLRAGTGLLLGVSGALMFTASWQRWAGVCGWRETDGGLCATRQDHRYDFVAPSDPWEPLGNAAQLAGWSFLVFALAFVLLPWALIGRRRLDALSVVSWIGVVLALVVVGVAALRSGLAGSVVRPYPYDPAAYVWVLVLPALLVRFAVASRGWALAAAVWLVLATPFVAALSYGVGPFDARPWSEAISGLLTASAGLCLLIAAALDGRSRSRGRRSAGRPQPEDGPADLRAPRSRI